MDIRIRPRLFLLAILPDTFAALIVRDRPHRLVSVACAAGLVLHDLADASTQVDGRGLFLFVHHRIAIPHELVVIIDVLATWNDYIWPLVTLQSEFVKTFPLGLIGLQNALQVNYGELFAAYVVASLPLLLLFMFTMRYFVRGLTSGAIRA